MSDGGAMAVLWLAYGVVCYGVGYLVGWSCRAVQFAEDRDCANPDHPED